LVTIGSGVSEGAGVEFPTFPLTCVVVLKTLWHYRASVWFICWQQWLKCNRTQWNAVPPPPIYGSKRSPTSDCYNTKTNDHCQGPKPECSVPPPLILHFNHWLTGSRVWAFDMYRNRWPWTALRWLAYFMLIYQKREVSRPTQLYVKVKLTEASPILSA